MQLSIEELKGLIIWAREQKVKILEVPGIKVEFTELAFIEQVHGLDSGQSSNPEVSISTKTFADEISKDEAAEYDELLFHSSRP